MNGREGSFVHGVLTFQTCGEHNMVSLYYYMGKLLIQLTLFVVFLLFFGLPSYRRYHEKVYDGFFTLPLCFQCRQKAFSDDFRRFVKGQNFLLLKLFDIS